MRLAAVTVVLLSLASVARAQVVSQFDIQAQPLGDALRLVASQANANILYDPGLVKGRQAAAFSMKSTLDEALLRVLEGSGLKHQYVDEKTVTLVRVEPQAVTAKSDKDDIKPADERSTSTSERASSPSRRSK